MMANWGFSTEKDFEVADGWEQVRLWQQKPDGTYTAYLSTQNDNLGRALREIPKRKQVAFGESVDVIWHLNIEQWPNIKRVSPGDVVQAFDDCTVWVIQSVDKGHVQDAWVCQSIKFVGQFKV